MGVMSCDRQGCNNIMCDRLILRNSRYICNDCFQELLLSKSEWPKDITVVDVVEQIKLFMDTEPGTHKMLNQDEIDEEFRRQTGD